MKREALSNETTFYCLNCGRKGIPIVRKRSKQKEKFHRKKLYCWHCKQEVNHIECRTDEDIKEFKLQFAAGAYQDEAQTSMITSKQHDIFSLLEVR